MFLAQGNNNWSWRVWTHAQQAGCGSVLGRAIASELCFQVKDNETRQEEFKKRYLTSCLLFTRNVEDNLQPDLFTVYVPPSQMALSIYPATIDKGFTQQLRNVQQSRGFVPTKVEDNNHRWYTSTKFIIIFVKIPWSLCPWIWPQTGLEWVRQQQKYWSIAYYSVWNTSIKKRWLTRENSHKERWYPYNLLSEEIYSKIES